MKIEITPEVIELFNEEGQPAICSIGSKNVCFNKPATRLLSIDTGSQFLLDFEDGQMYYKESLKGFKLANSGKNVAMCNITGIGKFVEKLYKKNIKLYRFEIGELKDGRRKLELVA